MTSDSSSDVKLEIGHVLFIDIVGYSKLLITDQSEQLQKLKRDRAGNRTVPAGGSRKEPAAATDR